jgi:hypothetical protein
MPCRRTSASLTVCCGAHLVGLGAAGVALAAAVELVVSLSAAPVALAALVVSLLALLLALMVPVVALLLALVVPLVPLLPLLLVVAEVRHCAQSECACPIDRSARDQDGLAKKAIGRSIESEKMREIVESIGRSIESEKMREMVE